MAGLIQARGLNPWLGHLHATSAGHMALASDLMEEFRAPIIDAVLLNACLNGHLTPADFVSRNGSHTLRPDAARAFIRAVETRLNSEQRHPLSNELLDARRIIDAQIRSLCACYRQQGAQPCIPCLATICRFIHRLAGALLRSKLLVWCRHTAQFAPCIASRQTRLNRQIAPRQGIAPACSGEAAFLAPQLRYRR